MAQDDIEIKTLIERNRYTNAYSIILAHEDIATYCVSEKRMLKQSHAHT